MNLEGVQKFSSDLPHICTVTETIKTSFTGRAKTWTKIWPLIQNCAQCVPLSNRPRAPRRPGVKLGSCYYNGGFYTFSIQTFFLWKLFALLRTASVTTPLAKRIIVTFNINLSCGKYMTLYLFIIDTVMGDIQCCLVLLEVGENAAVGHKRHDDVRGWPSIKTHTRECENMGMLKVIHLWTLIKHIFGSWRLIKICTYKIMLIILYHFSSSLLKLTFKCLYCRNFCSSVMFNKVTLIDNTILT